MCRQSLNSYTSEKLIIKHKQQSDGKQITNNKTSSESHFYWKNLFRRNPLFFRVYADFEVDNEKDKISIGNKTTNIYKQNPACKGYYIVSELEDVLKSGYLKSL